MDHLEQACFFKNNRWQGPKMRAHFRVADRARRVDQYGSTRFVGRILVQKVVAVFWVHWQFVIDFFQVTVFLPVGVGNR